MLLDTMCLIFLLHKMFFHLTKLSLSNMLNDVIWFMLNTFVLRFNSMIGSLSSTFFLQTAY